MRPSVVFPRTAVLVVVLTVTSVFAQSTTPPATLAELQQRLTEHLANPRFAPGLFGVKIVSLDTGKTLFEHAAGKFFSPASNSKLYTMALALDKLGGDYRIKTSLYAAAKPDKRGTLKGDLIVYGRGDPTINGRLDGDLFMALEPLVTALADAGVKRISGDLVGDDSFFQGAPYGSGWTWDDLQYYYGAEISALTINDNTLRISVKPGASNGAPCRLALSPATTYLGLSNRTQTVSSGRRRNLSFYRPIEENVIYVTGQMPLDEKEFTNNATMHNPAGLFVAFFKEALTRQGIKVSGKTRTANWLDRQVKPLDLGKLVELGAAESPPMRDLVREVQKPSQNLYTDLILAHIGETERRSPTRRGTESASQSAGSETGAPMGTETSEDIGIRELQKFLTKAGVKHGDVQFEEGSGLSRNNLTTPNATIVLLQFMSRHTEADAYLNALPIAGVDGTLRNRMENTSAAGNVQAKTGTLRWAHSLSGHVKTAAGERLIFSLMLNRYVAPDAGHSGRAELDQIALMLAGFTGRSEPWRATGNPRGPEQGGPPISPGTKAP